jgi:serine O-acetyltransferase
MQEHISMDQVGKKTYSVEYDTGRSRDERRSYDPAHWLSLYKQDIARYKKHRSHTPTAILLLTEQGLWALLPYRMASALYRSHVPVVMKMPLITLAAVQKVIEIVVGITIPYQASVGPGLYIGHFGNIVLSPEAVIGHTCNLSQGVTIGVSGRGERRGVPKIGNRVYIAANAVVAGNIDIGDDVVIAANSLVIADVPAHTTVMGVPAQVVNVHGSEEYLDP